MNQKTEQQSQQNSPPQMPPIGGYPAAYGYYPQEDEINLIDLWKVLAKKKMTILGTTVLITIGAVIFALIQPPVYKAESILLPPTKSDIQSLDVQGVQGVQGVSVDSVYNNVKKNLSSISVQRNFFNQHNILNQLTSSKTKEISSEQVFRDFIQMINISTDKKSKERVTITLEHSDPNVAANWINDFSNFVNTTTINQLTDNLRSAVDNNTRNIEYTINSKRKMAAQRREDYINLLQEALTTSTVIGIEVPLEISNISQSTQSNILTNNSTTPLYYRGSKALTAEINTLKNRASDDPFISGLRDLQERLAHLKSIKVDNTQLNALTVDQAAYPPESRIKPKRKLIVVLGFVLGLMLGIFGAFFSNFFENQRREEEEAVTV